MQIGCVLNFDAGGIQDSTWLDASGNNLNATLTNTTTLNKVISNFANKVTGVEYDTGERIDGQIVWGKIINFGQVPNNTQKNVAHGITGLNFQKVTLIEGIGYDGLKAVPTGLLSTAAANQIVITVDGTNVGFLTISDRSSYTVPRLILNYLK
jgi:hypothetical protein